MTSKHKLAVLAAVIAAITSAFAGSTVIGRKARLVDMVTLFAGGFGAGASLTAALIKGRSDRPTDAEFMDRPAADD